MGGHVRTPRGRRVIKGGSNTLHRTASAQRALWRQGAAAVRYGRAGLSRLHRPQSQQAGRCRSISNTRQCCCGVTARQRVERSDCARLTKAADDHGILSAEGHHQAKAGCRVLCAPHMQGGVVVSRHPPRSASASSRHHRPPLQIPSLCLTPLLLAQKGMSPGRLFKRPAFVAVTTAPC